MSQIGRAAEAEQTPYIYRCLYGSGSSVINTHTHAHSSNTADYQCKEININKIDEL